MHNTGWSPPWRFDSLLKLRIPDCAKTAQREEKYDSIQCTVWLAVFGPCLHLITFLDVRLLVHNISQLEQGNEARDFELPGTRCSSASLGKPQSSMLLPHMLCQLVGTTVTCSFAPRAPRDGTQVGG